MSKEMKATIDGAADALPDHRDRMQSLDALRGLAALSVVFQHVMQIYGTNLAWLASAAQGSLVPYLLMRTPVGIFHAGHAAVILFFTLSGFVLTLPFLSNRKPRYSSFFIRRVCRIYIPYAVALLVAVVARSMVNVGPVAGTSEWFRPSWISPPTWGSIAGYLAMTGFSHHTSIDFVVWSLIHEMRISLIFPFLIAVTSRTHFSLNVFAAFVVSVLCNYGSMAIPHGSFATDLISSLMETGGYVWYFVVGIELARHRKALVAWMAELNRIEVVLIFVLSVTLYSQFDGPAIAYITWLGAAGLIVLAFGRNGVERRLKGPALLLLGRISYSLYLFHPIVLMTLVYGLHSGFSPTAIVVAIVLISIAAAWVAWWLIEMPAIWLGRYLTRGSARGLGVVSVAKSGLRS